MSQVSSGSASCKAGHRRLSNGSQSNLSRSRERLSQHSRTSSAFFGSKEKQKVNQISNKDQVPLTSPLTPLLHNILLNTSKQDSQSSKNQVSTFTAGEQGVRPPQKRVPAHMSSRKHKISYCLTHLHGRFRNGQGKHRKCDLPLS